MYHGCLNIKSFNRGRVRPHWEVKFYIAKKNIFKKTDMRTADYKKSAMP